MPKREATVKQVLAASAEILKAHNGKMPYNEWKAAVEEKLGASTQAIIQINKHKLVPYWLEGMNEDGSPNLFVVDKLPTNPTA